MRCGNRHAMLVVALVAASAFVLLSFVTAQAQSAQMVAKLTPEAGRIADAALLGGDHLVLLYPELGHIADYTLDGTLHQHIVREGGVERRFRPTACIANGADSLLVFDEAAHKVFFIGADGNITRGIDLAYPDETGALLALSRVGDIAVSGSDVLWAMLPERATLAGFDLSGNHVISLDLGELLPYSPATYTRAQLLADGSLYILDYYQGAVLYRRGITGAFRRLRLEGPDGADAIPAMQDFAVDNAGNVLVATHDADAPLVLLTPGTNGYESHNVELSLPDGVPKLACRCSGGKFIVWARDETEVFIIEITS